ncbi:hypothetical protein ACCS95_32915 [Rhizobium ruizarguesonis]
MPSNPHHLWEIHHSYGFLMPSERPIAHRSWDEFLAHLHRRAALSRDHDRSDVEMKMMHLDPFNFMHNLVVYWNWFEGYRRIGSKYMDRPDHRNGRFRMWVPGNAHTSGGPLIEVWVCRNDEPRVKAFLTDAMAFLVKSIWYPIAADGQEVVRLPNDPTERDRQVFFHHDFNWSS